MTKTNNYPVPSAKDLVENFENSPYFNVACEMLRRRGIEEPNIADYLECFHEIAKIDSKINKGVK